MRIEAGLWVALAQVKYAPTELGDDEGELRLELRSTRAREELRVPLFGTGGGPDIDVTPAQINFGLTSVLAPARRSIILTNVGFETLRIFDLRFEPGTRDFVVAEAPALPFDLEPGADAVVDIQFQPEANEGRWETRLIIESSDPDERLIAILLRGENMTRPDCPLTVTPNALQFGVLLVGATASRTITLTNDSELQQCLVGQVRLSEGTDPAFALVADGWDPNATLLPPGGELPIEVRVTPLAAGLLQGGLTFVVSNPDVPFRAVVLTATATRD